MNNTDWIDKARHWYLYDYDCDSLYPQEAIDEANKEPATIESKKIFRKAIEDNMPKENILTYEQWLERWRQILYKEWWKDWHRYTLKDFVEYWLKYNLLPK
jgi:hypothetical protein